MVDCGLWIVDGDVGILNPLFLAQYGLLVGRVDEDDREARFGTLYRALGVKDNFKR